MASFYSRLIEIELDDGGHAWICMLLKKKISLVVFFHDYRLMIVAT